MHYSQKLQGLQTSVSMKTKVFSSQFRNEIKKWLHRGYLQYLREVTLFTAWTIGRVQYVSSINTNMELQYCSDNIDIGWTQ